MSLLKVNNLHVNVRTKGRKKIQILDDVSFSLKKGEILGIVGESGCGKTTLSRSLLNLMDGKEGNIVIDGKNLEEYTRKNLAKEIQMIFQNPMTSFQPRNTLEQSLKEVATIHGIPRKDFLKKKEQLYLYAGLSAEMETKYPSQLSGGQLQRFAIVRALLVEPKILIADEAVSALDVSIQADILNLLLYLREKLDISILFISHDLRVVENLADRVMVMYAGKVVEIGKTEELFRTPKHAYTKLLLASQPRTSPREHEKKENVG